MYSKYLHVSSSTIFGILLHKQNIIITIFLSLSKLQCTIHTCTIFWGEMLIWRNFVISFLCSFSFGVTQTSLFFILVFFKNESLPKTSCTDSTAHLVCRIVSILVLHYNKMTIVVGVFLYTSWGVEILIYDDAILRYTRCDHFDALEWTDTKLRPKRPMRRSSIHTN